jgi:hypothetical protein
MERTNFSLFFFYLWWQTVGGSSRSPDPNAEFLFNFQRRHYFPARTCSLRRHVIRIPFQRTSGPIRWVIWVTVGVVLRVRCMEYRQKRLFAVSQFFILNPEWTIIKVTRTIMYNDIFWRTYSKPSPTVRSTNDRSVECRRLRMMLARHICVWSVLASCCFIED